MKARVLLATLGAFALFAIASISAFAWTGDLDGHPNLTKDNPVGYYIWHNEDGLHLRTHGPGDEHYFTARLRTDGMFEKVEAVRLENKDNYEILDNGHLLVLRFHTYDFTDGLNFRVQGGTKLHFNLHLDRKPIATESIYLGDDGNHPATNPFTITR